MLETPETHENKRYNDKKLHRAVYSESHVVGAEKKRETAIKTTVCSQKFLSAVGKTICMLESPDFSEYAVQLILFSILRLIIGVLELLISKVYVLDNT